MSNQEMKNPLRLALLFFRWFCHDDLREEIEGDLVERFYQRSKHYGHIRNQWLFINDVLSLFRPRIFGKFYRLTAFPHSFIKLIYNNLRTTAFVIAPLWCVSFIVLTLTNSKSCKQFVIDSSEMRMGIDIPKADFCTCIYDVKKDIRLSAYTLKEGVDGYIDEYDFKPIDAKDVHFSMTLPAKDKPGNKQLYAKSGKKWGDTWQYLIEKETGRIWIEINFKPTPVIKVIQIITRIIFHLSPMLLVVLYMFKYARMTYLNMRKLKITWF